jgi:hypothetical protein
MASTNLSMGDEEAGSAARTIPWIFLSTCEETRKIVAGFRAAFRDAA